MHIEVLRVVDILMRSRLDPIEHARLEIQEDGAGNVACVVGLVEEDIFAVAAFGREGLEVAVAVDAMFEAQLLPELRTDFGSGGLAVWWGLWWGGVGVPLLPHWPA